jgi:photosystem II stability/assembly factor-like uncharacterized protein
MRTVYLTLLAFLLTTTAFAQPWLKNLPANKSKAELTLFDYQHSFESYWAPFNVSKGKFVENGVTKKAPGWKQFKRWEYEMESLVNPATGEFPKKSALKEVEEYNQSNPRTSVTNIANWTPMGPTSSFSGYSGIGRLNCIGFHPTDNNTYWVGAAAGGIWRTTDNGATWTCLTNNTDALAVSNIAVTSDYATSNTIYIATGDRDGWDNRSVGVLKSTDGGTTWNPTGISYTIFEGRMVNRLLIDPNNNNILIAATTIGVYKTTDGGAIWNQQMFSGEFIDMEYHPGNSNIIYGSTKSGEIYLCTDGNTFGPAVYSDSNARRIELAVSPNQPNWVYAVAANGDNGLYAIFKSTDSGGSFNEVFNGIVKNLLTWESDGSGTGGQGWYDLALAASPVDANILLVGGVNTWRSTNGGADWSIVNHWYGDGVQSVHADKHMLSYRSNGTLFECNDGGVYRSGNNGTNWVDRTDGIQISQMYRLGVSQTDPDDIITGLQDNGSKLHTGPNWFDVRGGDGMECLIDYTDVNIQYATVYYGEIDRTTDHWQSSTAIQPNDNGAWVTPYIIDPTDPAILYAGYDEVWKTYDRGDNWEQISSLNINSKVRSMAIAASDTRYLYIADHNTIWKTTDGGGNWTDITNNLPVNNANIDYITIRNDDPNTIWVALSGYSNPGVYQSVDGGANWTNMSAGLPPIPAYVVVQNIQSQLEVQLYLGTELGVYFKKGNNDWEPYNDGLPNVKIGEIEIYYAANPGESRLRAASFGRGLWETTIEYTATPMVYISSTTTQKKTASVAPGELNQEIIKVVVNTNGNLTPLSATSFTFNTNGSISPVSDITNAKLYYTGTTNAFSTTTQFGSTIVLPDGSFTLTGDQVLGDGKNNFWLTYDINTTAILGNKVDAQCTSLVVGSPQSLVVSDPPGSRTISFDYCDAGASELTYEYISNVAIGAINQSSGKEPGGYSDYTSQVIDMTLGTSMDIFVKNGSPYEKDEVLIWVDWNADGDFFDADELVHQSGPSGDEIFSASFSTPPTAQEGVTRMRVRLHDSQNGPLDEPCGFSQWGEVEDYSLHISAYDACRILNYFDYKTESIRSDYEGLGSDGTVIVTAEFDNANSSPQDIGFTFEYKCQPYTQFVLNTNGFIKLGDTPPSAAALFFDDPGAATGGIFNNNDPADVNLISPLNLDLTGGTGHPEYRVFTRGVAPERVCTIQYQDVREANADPIPQYDNMEFQIKLYETTNIIEFIYGDWTPSGNEDDFRAVACGLKGSSRAGDQLLIVSKGSQQTWEDVNFANANYLSTSPIYYSKPPDSPKPDAGRTLRFVPKYDHDLRVGQIYALGEASTYYNSPQSISVNILNAGNNDQAFIPVTLIIAGANNFTETKFVAALARDEEINVPFSDFIPTAQGITTFEISLPGDEDNTQNTITWVQNTNEFNSNYADLSAASQSWGVSAGQEQIYFSKYHINGSAEVNAVQAFIPNDVRNIGQSVFGVILNSGEILTGQSALHTILDSDLGSWLTLPINTPPLVQDDEYYAGYGVTASATDYFPLGLQDEYPQRPETYFHSPLGGIDLQPFNFPYRLMIGAILSPIPPVAGEVAPMHLICSGNHATVSLNGSSGQIQWQQSADGATGWTNVTGGSGATSIDYTTDTLTFTTFYRAEVIQPTFPPVYSNSSEVAVIARPGVAGEIIGDTVVCQYGGTFIYTVGDIENATWYGWSLPAGAIGSSSTNSILVTFGASISGDITVSGANDGCSGVGSSLFIHILDAPDAPVIGDITQPDCSLSTGTIILEGLPLTGTWKVIRYPDEHIVNGNGSPAILTGIPVGSFTYTVEDEFGCVSDFSSVLTISPQPVTPDAPVITANDNILLSDAPSGNQWYDQNGLIPGATDQEYTATVDGDYYCIVTLNGCPSSASNVLHVIVSALENTKNVQGIHLYPNPVSNELFVVISGNMRNVDYQIQNAVGHEMARGIFSEKITIETTSFSPGIYFIQLEGDGFVVIRKFVKE